MTEGVANVYLVAEDPVTLVDTGINTAAAFDDLEEKLREYDTTVRDIEQVCLTHCHADHGGLAGRIQTVSDATVFLHEGDEDRVDPTQKEWLSIAESQYEKLRSWGVPESKIRELRSVQDENYKFHSDPVEVAPVSDGAAIRVGDTELEVIHTPGHTVGSACYALPGRGLFTGDTVLPVYTPNIGGADMRLDEPLGTYLESLRRLIERQPERGYPGHRHVIERTAERAHEISLHHREQARIILEALDEFGMSDVWTLTGEVYRAVADIHVVLGAGETKAHLRHLQTLDLVERRTGGYVLQGDVESAMTRLASAWPQQRYQ